MSEGELSRMVRLRPLPAQPVMIEASETERAALAKRFGLPRIDRLTASLALADDGKAVCAKGRLKADVTQLCAVSGEEFAVRIDEPLTLRFVEQHDLETHQGSAEIEIELGGDECDEIGFSGEAFDLGEAVAQSLGLAIDPYATGPNADAARKAAGIIGDDMPSGPLAEALKALKIKE
ncbi:MAG: DNA-binding protein [Erythrobacter sp. RIFCSPHIGHO2_12_FULL_63_10]|nr:MAG: DNA-binding protein [Erythrobacter sp. RIFCSPHIGHO2_12_FULL_63_10]